MADESRPTKRVDTPAGTDITGVLERASVEHLVVNDTRLVAISGRSIFIVDVIDGCVTSADVLAVQLWAPPPTGEAPDSLDALLNEFVDVLDPSGDGRECGSLVG